MKEVVTTIYGNDVNTDNIIPADVLQETTSKREFAKYAFQRFDKGFVERSDPGPNVIVSGSNFGSGSSREQAVYALQYNNVAFVIAEKDPRTGTAYPDIFYRNALTQGLPLITLDDVSDIQLGDELELLIRERTVYNLTHGAEYLFSMSDEDAKILEEGGLIGRAKKDLFELLSEKE